MYDFDTPIDRNSTGALKWDRRTDEEKRLGVVPMSVADMEFAVAPCIKSAVLRAAEHGIYGYTDPEPRYFESVKRWFNARSGLSVETEDICCLNGCVPAISAAVRAFTREGEGVIIQTPVYYPFGDMIASNGRQVVENPLVYNADGTYSIDFDGLESAARRDDVKLMLLCSPHNPVGRVWTAGELQKISDICERNGVLVASDEIHGDLILRGTHTPFMNINPRCILMTSPSKTFNIPGLQLANIIIKDKNIRNAFWKRTRADGYSNIPYFAWAATIAAYDSGAEWLDALLEYLRENFNAFRAFFETEFPDIKVTPLEGTYLAWANFRSLGLKGKQLENLTRNKAHLVLDEGYIFGEIADGFERFNIALPRAQLMQNLERLKNVLKEKV